MSTVINQVTVHATRDSKARTIPSAYGQAGHCLSATLNLLINLSIYPRFPTLILRFPPLFGSRLDSTHVFVNDKSEYKLPIMTAAFSNSRP
jgi:hypothetical protein